MCLGGIANLRVTIEPCILAATGILGTATLALLAFRAAAVTAAAATLALRRS